MRLKINKLKKKKIISETQLLYHVIRRSAAGGSEKSVPTPSDRTQELTRKIRKMSGRLRMQGTEEGCLQAPVENSKPQPRSGDEMRRNVSLTPSGPCTTFGDRVLDSRDWLMVRVSWKEHRGAAEY